MQLTFVQVILMHLRLQLSVFNVVLICRTNSVCSILVTDVQERPFTCKLDSEQCILMWGTVQVPGALWVGAYAIGCTSLETHPHELYLGNDRDAKSNLSSTDAKLAPQKLAPN